MKRNVLVLSEDAKVRERWGVRLRERGDSPTLAGNGTEALRIVKNVSVDLVVIEARHVTPAILSLRSQIQSARPGIRVVVLTAFGSIRSSPDLLRFGDGDFLLAGDQVLDLVCGIPGNPPAGGESSGIALALDSLVHTIDLLVGLLEIRDDFFAGSSHRAARLVRAVAEEMGLDDFAVREAVLGCLLRDLGKVELEPGLLNSLGEFTPEQWDAMKEHVEGSVRLLEHIDFPWKVVPVIRHHHERYDGRGYPDGLKGREIPLGARILAAVDAYTAMVSPRPHREAHPPERAIEILQRQVGAQLDPEVVEILIRVLDRLGPCSGSASSGEVLIVEPDEDFRNVLKMRLMNEGLRVREAFDEEDALTDIAESAPDVVVADAGPSEGDGLAFARTIREHRDGEPLPVVLVSRDENPILRLRALRQGVEDVFDRSGNLEELVARVQNILARETARLSGTVERRKRGISGQLGTFSLPDLVQVLTMGMKTAQVSLANGPFDGSLWFLEGALVHAVTGAVEGAPAVYEMLRWTSGEFTIEHGVESPARTIEEDAMFLVMEGLRQIDESSSGDRAAS